MLNVNYKDKQGLRIKKTLQVAAGRFRDCSLNNGNELGSGKLFFYFFGRSSNVESGTVL